MKKEITKIRKALQSRDHSHYVCWSGVYFDTNNRFIRLDKLFLNVVAVDGTDIRFRRLVAIPKMEQESPEDYIKYSLKTYYRIVEGERRGLVVSPEELEDEECFAHVGLSKRLEYGKTPSRFHTSRSGDRAVFPMLTRLSEDVEETPDGSVGSVVPDMYLTCAKDNFRIYARKNGYTAKYLQGFREYNPDKTLDTNLRRLRRRIAVDVGQDRVGYPFEMIYGRGVKAAAIASRTATFGKWYAVKDLKLNLPHIRIET